jgi:hypothetical protein
LVAPLLVAATAAAFYLLRPETVVDELVDVRPPRDDEAIRQVIERHFADTFDHLGYLEIDYTIKNIGSVETAADGWHEVTVETDAMHYDTVYHIGRDDRLRISPDYRSVQLAPPTHSFALSPREKKSLLETRKRLGF